MEGRAFDHHRRTGAGHLPTKVAHRAGYLNNFFKCPGGCSGGGGCSRLELTHIRPNQKICVSGYMLLKIRVGRSDYFFYFLKSFCLSKALFIKTKLLYLHFSVCHVVSRLVVPSFSMAISLISADVLSTARERYKNTFSKVIFNISCNKNRLETENIFLREESIVKNQK